MGENIKGDEGKLKFSATTFATGWDTNVARATVTILELSKRWVG